MRALAITGMVTAAMISLISPTSLMRATPPSRRMSAGTRSRAITATAPASSAILACSALTTSMMTPPRSISARPRFTRDVPVTSVVTARGGGELDRSFTGRAYPPRVALTEEVGLGVAGVGGELHDDVGGRDLGAAHDRVGGADQRPLPGGRGCVPDVGGVVAGGEAQVHAGHTLTGHRSATVGHVLE